MFPNADKMLDLFAKGKGVYVWPCRRMMRAPLRHQGAMALTDPPYPAEGRAAEEATGTSRSDKKNTAAAIAEGKAALILKD